MFSRRAFGTCAACLLPSALRARRIVGRRRLPRGGRFGCRLLLLAPRRLEVCGQGGAHDQRRACGRMAQLELQCPQVPAVDGAVEREDRERETRAAGRRRNGPGSTGGNPQWQRGGARVGTAVSRVAQYRVAQPLHVPA